MKAIRLLARLIVVLSAVFWIVFVVASLVGYYWVEPGPRPGESPLKSILVAAGFVLVLIGAIYLAWRPPLIAGISFILIGVLATAAFFNVATSKGVVVMLGLPPLISGILFLIFWRRSRSPHA